MSRSPITNSQESNRWVRAVILQFSCRGSECAYQKIHSSWNLAYIPQIASLAFGFGSTLSDAVYHYHSIFDSERWMETYGDPDFARHARHSTPTSTSLTTTPIFQVAVAQHLGLQILRLADSWILPINTTHYSIELQSYLDKSASFRPTSLPFTQHSFSGSKISPRTVPSNRKLIFMNSVTPSRNCEKPA
jgi:hypothetical protein